MHYAAHTGTSIFAARCYPSAAYAVMPCLSVCPSVTFVNSVKTKRVFKIFLPSGSHIILVYRNQAIFRLGPLMGASNAGGVGPNRDCWLISGYRSMTAERASNNCDGRPCSLSHGRRRISESLFITACSMDEYAEEKRREQNLIVRSSKSKAEVTNNKRPRSRYRIAEANYRQTRNIARLVCNSRATVYWTWATVKFSPRADDSTAMLTLDSNSVRLSVRLSVCLSRSGIVSKRLNISSYRYFLQPNH